MMVDSRKRLDEAGLFESYLRSQLFNSIQLIDLLSNPTVTLRLLLSRSLSLFGFMIICMTFEFDFCFALKVALPYTFGFRRQDQKEWRLRSHEFLRLGGARIPGRQLAIEIFQLTGDWEQTAVT